MPYTKNLVATKKNHADELCFRNNQDQETAEEMVEKKISQLEDARVT